MKVYGLILCLFTCLLQASQVPKTHKLQKKVQKKLWRAIELQDLKGLMDSLATDCDIDFTIQNKQTQNPLMAAVLEGDFAIVSALLDYGAPLNIQDRNGSTALMFAIINAWRGDEYSKIAHLLINYGAQVNLADNGGMTPLMIAVAVNNLSLIEHLVARGANFMAEDKTHKKAFAYAKSAENLLEIKERVATGIKLYGLEQKMLDAIDEKDGVKVLQELFDESKKLVPNVNIKNKYGTPLLFLAVKKGNLGLVRFFLQHHAPTSLKDMHGNTALMHAAFTDKKEVVELLLDAGTDINERSDGRITPLIAAIVVGKARIADLLVKRGADIDAVDCDGLTALMEAVRRNKPAIIQLLVAHGANEDIRDFQKNRAIDYATDQNRVAIENALEAGRKERSLLELSLTRVA